MQQKNNGKYATTVNVRINGIVRHKTGWYDAGATRDGIRDLKNRLIAELHEMWGNDYSPCKASSKKLPQAFKDYHKAQEDAYGRIKFQIERDESRSGTAYYSVHAMSKYGGYLRNKLDYVEEKEVLNFIELNPVGE